MDMTWPLASSSWGDEEIEAGIAVLRSGRTTMGDRVQAFEAAFAAQVGARYAVMCNSGSSANLLMVSAAMLLRVIGPDTWMLAPAVGWATTYAPLRQHNLDIMLLDVDPETLNVSLDDLRNGLRRGRQALMAVNLLGNACDYPAIREIIGDMPILEDNCESLGAVVGARQAGTFGLAASFSTFFSHHLNTMEGGVVVTDDRRFWETLLSLRAHGWTRDLPADSCLVARRADPFDEAFRFILPGYNVRPMEIAAAIGLVQLARLPALLAARRRNADLMRAVVDPVPWLRLQRETGRSSWMGFGLICETAERRQLLRRALVRAGIEHRPIAAGNFMRQEASRYLRCNSGGLAGADAVHDRGLYLGNHGRPLDREIEAFADAVATID